MKKSSKEKKSINWGPFIITLGLMAIAAGAYCVVLISQNGISGIAFGGVRDSGDGAMEGAAFFEEYFDVLTLISGICTALAGTLLIVTRILYKHKIKETTDRIRSEWERDALTGLLNRNGAKNFIEDALKEKKGGFKAFMMIDLDGLKRTNDVYGHDVGDATLKGFADAVRESFDEHGLIARIGGDEFVVFVNKNLNEKELKIKLKDFLKTLKLFAPVGIHLTCSVGVVPIRGFDARDYAVLYKQADLALYHAKKNGKDGYAFYNNKTMKPVNKGVSKKAVQVYREEDRENSAGKAEFDFKDVFVWLLDNYALQDPESMLLSGTKDFLMVVNPDSLDVEDIVSTEKGKEERLFEDFSNKKCYEAISGKKKRCADCPISVSNRRSYRFAERYSASLDATFMERSTFADINNKEYFVHVYKEIKSVEDESLAYKEATNCQNLVTACAYCDVDPITDPNKYFKYQIEAISRFYGAEMGYILRMDGDMQTAVYNIPDKEIPSLHLDMSEYASKHWQPKMDQNYLVYVDDVEKLIEKEPRVYSFFRASGVRNACIAPIWDGYRVYGYLCLRNISQNEGELFTLCTCSSLIRDTMKHISEVEENMWRKFYDETTDSFNYMGFKRELAAMDIFDRSVRYAICSWDIKGFKYINETYGHTTANGVLQDVAESFSRKMSEKEVVCRVDSDHFCALLQCDDENVLLERFTELSRSVSDMFTVSGKGKAEIEFAVGAYVINPITDKNNSIDKIQNMASIAQKKAKEQKGTSVLFYDEEMKKLVQRETLINSELENAMKNKEFQVYLQPQVYIGKAENPDGEDVVRAEVLCRWIKNGEVFASPMEFIPILENNGQIQKLDLYMLDQACAIIEKLRNTESFKTRLAVNISRITLLKGDFMREYDHFVKNYHIQKNELELEFTEGIAVTDFDKFYEVLNALRSRGCLCAMDDFGSDYSSLNVLQKLPLDVLKMDKKFFEVGHEEKRHDTIVQDTIKMAKDLNMITIAEGIEHGEQAKKLEEARCDYIQGFVFAKPMPINDYLDWARRHVSEKNKK